MAKLWKLLQSYATYSFLISSFESTWTGAGPLTETAPITSCFPFPFGPGDVLPVFPAGFFDVACAFCLD